MRVKFNPLALLLDASLEGEYDLVQRVIYEVSPTAWRQSVAPVTVLRFLSHWFWLVLQHFVLTIMQHVRNSSQATRLRFAVSDLPTADINPG